MLNWPKGGEEVSLVAGLQLTLRTLLFGPLRAAPAPLWPWLAVAGLLPLAGLWALRRTWAAVALGLWLLLPIGLMAVLGLFTPAFLKFLLVASPAWCLLAAAAPFQATQPDLSPPVAKGTLRAFAPSRLRVRHFPLSGGRDARDPGDDVATRPSPLAPRHFQNNAEGQGSAWWVPVGMFLVAGFGLAAAAMVLPGYYSSPTTRDNYQGVAAYLAAVGDPGRDLVVLNAPGQQEVWRYYDPGLPVVALPAARPADPAATAAALEAATAGKRHVYALFWATDEADPAGLVEGWLDRNGFEARDSWQGNLRLAVYALANALVRQAVEALPFGDSFAVVAQAQPAFPQVVTAGESALVRLHWDVLQDVDRRYKVSVQLLDARNQVVAQRDSEPVGGARPTDGWRAGEQIEDNYALPIPFGTPPGQYRLIMAVYDGTTGERLLRNGADYLALGDLTVERPAAALPAELLPLQHRRDDALGAVTLVGYDAYRQGYAHAPATPVAVGDTVHFTFYWQAPALLPPDWPGDATMTLRLGDQEITAPLAGGNYPTGAWTAGELVRGEFDLRYTGGGRRPELRAGEQRVQLAPLPGP